MLTCEIDSWDKLQRFMRPCLVPIPRAPPAGEKWAGEQRQIFGAYCSKLASAANRSFRMKEVEVATATEGSVELQNMLAKIKFIHNTQYAV